METIHIISDTHSKHAHYKLPGGDVLIHCGDCTSRGTLPEVIEFLNWFADQDYSYLVMIAGNHDWAFEQNPELMLAECRTRKIILLNDSGVTIEGVKFWGSPVQPWFHDWAFNRHRGEEIKRHWDLIPNDIDVLITHGPPYKILDVTDRGDLTGCNDLLEAIKARNIKLHMFGHIHEARGHKYQDGVLYVNAASLDSRYRHIKGVPYRITITKDGIYKVEE